MAVLSRKPNCLRGLRAFLLLAAIAALCISEGVGLQLLPLRGASLARAAVEAPSLGNSGNPSRTPSRGQSASHKIEIAAPTTNRATVEHQTVRLFSEVLSVVFELEDETSTDVSVSNPIPYRPPVFASELTGRAPPTIA